MNIGGPESDGVFDIALDNNGNSYVTGYFSGTVDFDLSEAHPGNADVLSARGAHDGFVAKYAQDDSLVWVRRVGGDASSPTGMLTDVGRSLAVDSIGNVYVIGEFSESADFGTAVLASAGSRDCFVAKIDANGDFAWSSRWGVMDADVGHGVGVDGSGAVYALSTGGTPGHHIRKFNPNGTSAWSTTVGGASTSPGFTVSSSGNVFIAGSFLGTVDFDPGAKVKNVSSGTHSAGFVLKLDANGRFGWVTPFVGRQVGSTIGTAAATAVTLDGSGNVIVGGHYLHTVDFDPSSATATLNPAGGGFIAKLSSSGGLVWSRALTGIGTSVYGVAVDSSGSVYATGRFTSSVDLDPGTAVNAKTSVGEGDIFVVKLTASGNYSWGQSFGGPGLDVGFGIAVDGAGAVHLAGYFADAVDFNPDPLAKFQLGYSGAARDGFKLQLQQP